jgi:hypothetical protein
MCVQLYAAASMCMCEAHSLSDSMHVLLRDGLCVCDSVYVLFFACAYLYLCMRILHSCGFMNVFVSQFVFV